jgi:GMP synthase (glutamine-hydrolysing)
MSEILVLQHQTCEPLGAIEPALQRANHTIRVIQTQHGQAVPQDIEGSVGLIIMGGPMGVYEQDRYSFLGDEIRLIQHALKREIPILGICLGAQLLAAALGSPVRPGQKKEIGWHPVMLTSEAAVDPLWQDIPATFTGFHWHGDFFEKPHGAVSLASSALTPCQAFRYGAAVYGLQFHIEVTETMIQDWVTLFVGELTETNTDPATILEGIPRYLTPMHEIAQTVFDRWAQLL